MWDWLSKLFDQCNYYQKYNEVRILLREVCIIPDPLLDELDLSNCIFNPDVSLGLTSVISNNIFL